MTTTSGTVSAVEVEEEASKNGKIITIADAEGEVTLTFGSEVYLHSIQVEYPEVVYYGTEWDWRYDGVGEGQNYYERGGSDTFADKNGVGTLTVSGGKFQGHKETYGTAGNSYTMTIPVMTKCTVKVKVGYHWYVWADGENVTSSFTEEEPATHENTGENNQDGYVTFTYTGEGPGEVVIHTGSSDSYIAQVLVEYDPSVELPKPPVTADIVYTVGPKENDRDFQTITEALAAAEQAKRNPGQRITIAIDPGDYEEQLHIKVKDLTLKNAKAEDAELKLTDKGVNIGANEVRITWYYGCGYTYYSMTNGHRYDADVLEANKANGYASYINTGDGTTDNSNWNASVIIEADKFRAEGIIFENSFNQYVSAASVKDTIEAQGSKAKEGNVPRAEMKTPGDTKVQEKAYVERAAALTIAGGDEIFFDNCAFVSRQDTIVLNKGTKAAFYDCDMYGGTDYICGPMTAVFAKCNLIFNTSENNNDVGYITAPQQSSGRGYLMYNCHVTSTTPGVNTASKYRSKPGLFGRPWAKGTGEAIFYATNVEATDPIYVGATINEETANTSLILPSGWTNTLGGESAKCGEYQTVEYYTGVDNSGDRVKWVGTVTEAPKVSDFLGEWDPFAGKDMDIKTQDQQTMPETFPTPVTKITITEKAQELKKGDKVTLHATVEPENATDKTVYWTSSDVSVVTVDEKTGEVTAVDGGEATVYAKSANAMVSASVKVTVVIPVDSVTLNKSEINMVAGRTTTLTATVLPANATNKAVTFQSEDPAVATVDPTTGKVRGVAAGTTTITATSADDGTKTAVCTVTIRGGDTPEPETTYDITITPVTGANITTDPDGKAAAGDEVTVTVTVNDDTKEVAEVTYKVENDTQTYQATKGDDGKYTFTMPEANVTVTATLKDKEGQGGEEPGEITITITTDRVTVNTTATLRATVKPADAKYDHIYWVSDDTDVLTVTATGSAKGVKVGTATVHAYVMKTSANDVTDKDNVLAQTNKDIEVVKASSGGGGGYDTTGQTTTPAKTTTTTNDNGDTVKTETKTNGDKVVTVTDENGEVVAKVELPATAPELSYKFVDVPDSHWAAKAINEVAALGIVQGVSTEEHVFDMNSAITRAAMAQILYNLSQGKAGMTNNFTDSADAWYTDAIAWAASAGVVTGVSDTAFAPNDAITREQLVTMLYRYAKLLDLDVSKTGDLTAFVDGDAVDSWAADAMAWAVGAGLLQGKGNNDLDPTAAASRAETAVVMDRFLALVRK